MTNIRFRGVATKYLNNYIVYNNFVTFAKESFMEKIKILKNEIFTIGVEERSFSVNISKRDPSPLLKDQYLLWTEPWKIRSETFNLKIQIPTQNRVEISPSMS